MRVSPKLGQKGRELKQRARDKAADKSVLLSALCLGVWPVSDSLPFFVAALYSSAVLPGQIY